MLGSKPTRAAVASWNKQHGYDRPEIAQFFSYLGGLVHGNFGYSYKLSQTVGALFKENAGRSAYLSGAALVLSLIIASRSASPRRSSATARRLRRHGASTSRSTRCRRSSWD